MAINPLNEQLKILEDQINSKKEEDYNKTFNRYQQRLSTLQEPSRNFDFFDLATSLSQGLSAQMQTDRPNSIGAGLALGFNKASETMRQTQADDRKAKQQVALEAARLAMTDEQKANDFLNQVSLLRIKEANNPKSHIRIEGVASEQTNALLGRDETIGSPSFISIRDGGTNQIKIDELTDLGWATVTDPSSIVNIDQKTETTADKESAKAQADFQSKILDESSASSSTRDTITQARMNANKLTENGLYPERYGAVPEMTNWTRNVMAGLDFNIDKDRLAAEDLGNQLGVGFAMATVALTKGAISNREMEMFLQAAPTMGRTYLGYIEMLNYMDRMATRTEDFAEAYMLEKRRIEDVAETTGKKLTNSQVNDDLALFGVTWKRNNPLFTSEETSSLTERQDIKAYNKFLGLYTGRDGSSGSNNSGPQGNPVVGKIELRAQRDKIVKKLKNGQYPEEDIARAKQLLMDLNLKLGQ